MCHHSWGMSSWRERRTHTEREEHWYCCDHYTQVRLKTPRHRWSFWLSNLRWEECFMLARVCFDDGGHCRDSMEKACRGHGLVKCFLNPSYCTSGRADLFTSTLSENSESMNELWIKWKLRAMQAEGEKPALMSQTIQTMGKASLKYSFMPKGGDIGFSNGVTETGQSRALFRQAPARFVCPQPGCVVWKLHANCSLIVKDTILKTYGLRWLERTWLQVWRKILQIWNKVLFLNLCLYNQTTLNFGILKNNNLINQSVNLSYSLVFLFMVLAVWESFIIQFSAEKKNVLALFVCFVSLPFFKRDKKKE